MQSLKLGVSQVQKMKLSPQMYQSMQLMAMPLVDLQAKIKEEIERNPALEDIPSSSPLTVQKNVVNNEKNQDDWSSDEWDSYKGMSHSKYRNDVSGSYSDDSESSGTIIERTISRSEDLHEHLINQIVLMDLSEKILEIGKNVIYNLDERGFHKEDPFKLVNSGEEDTLEKVLNIVQHLDPVGCGTEDYMESLMVQSSVREDAPLEAIDFIRNHIKDYRPNKKEKIASSMSIDVSELDNILEFLKSLNPYPGRLYSSADTDFILPDLNIYREDGELKVFLNDGQIPELQITDFYEDISTKKDGLDRETRKFAVNSVRNAKWLINSIEQRNSTLLKTARVLVDYQKDFFRKGPKHLRPLTLKTIAEEVGVHETTISRITTSKYVQTEWGIFSLKYFFSNSVAGTGTGDEDFSKQSVKEILKEIIEGHDGKKRLSDQKLSDMLKEKGISLARRTVSKYRKELNIDSSFYR